MKLTELVTQSACAPVGFAVENIVVALTSEMTSSDVQLTMAFVAGFVTCSLITSMMGSSANSAFCRPTVSFFRQPSDCETYRSHVIESIRTSGQMQLSRSAEYDAEIERYGLDDGHEFVRPSWDDALQVRLSRRKTSAAVRGNTSPWVKIFDGVAIVGPEATRGTAERDAYRRWTKDDVGMLPVTTMRWISRRNGTRSALVNESTSTVIFFDSEDFAGTYNGDPYSRSPIPGALGWYVSPRPGLWLSMDDVMFSYDLWFEHTKGFSFSTWLGVSCQQDPMDAFAIQEMLWKVKPDLVIEVGTNTGGGAIFYSHIMRAYNPKALVLTLDVLPAPHDWNSHLAQITCDECESAKDHPYWKDGGIVFLQGNAGKNETFVEEIRERYASRAEKILVIEDAGHSYEGTYLNLMALAPLVTSQSYILVQDTKLDRFYWRMSAGTRVSDKTTQRAGPYRSMSSRLGPMASVDDFLETKVGASFRVDRQFEKFMYSQHHRGFLRRV